MTHAQNPHPVASSDDTLHRVVRGAHDAVDLVAAKAAPVIDQVKLTAAQASDVVHRSADQAIHLRDEWTESMRSTVREHPLVTVALAVAVGALLARITSSRAQSR